MLRKIFLLKYHNTIYIFKVTENIKYIGIIEKLNKKYKFVTLPILLVSS